MVRRSCSLLTIALACVCSAPAQFKFYDNGIGFINSDGIPEYQSFNRPRKKKPKKKPFPLKIGRVTVYEHGIGFINAQGTPEYQSVPGDVWDLLAQALAVNEGHYSINCPPLLAVTFSFGAPSKDPGASAGILGSPGSLTASVGTNPTGALVLHASDMRFDGMKGTAAQTPAGTQFTFTDTRTIGNPPQSGTQVTISFTLPSPPAGAAPLSPTNATVTMLAPADAQVGATQWTTNSTGIGYSNVAACNSPATPGEPVAIDTGEFLSDPEADLSLGGPLPLAFNRHYGSLLGANGVAGRLGGNWTHNFETKLAISGSHATVLLYDGAQMSFSSSGSVWMLDQKQPFAYQLVQNGSTYQFLDAQVNLIYTFSAAGALTSIQDRNGNTLTITQPNQVSDGLGRTLTLAYGSDGNLASVKDQTGRTVSFTYSGGSLATVTDANGKVTAYNYTAASLMTSVKRPGGNTTLSQTFDQSGRVARQVDGLSNATTFSYGTPAGGSGSMTDALGDKSQFDHVDLRNNTTITDPNGKVTTIVYDSANHPTQITDPLGGKTTVVYDAASGLPTSVTDASGATTTASYTPQTQGGFTYYVLSKQTYADGTSSAYTYDASGNLLSITDGAGKVTQITYNKQGQVLTIQNALGGVTTYTYNSDGTAASVKTPSGDATQFSYDAQKRVAKVTHPDGTTDAFTYDARDRLLQHTPASGAPEIYAYDDNGNVQSYTDLSGATYTVSYNADDQAASSKDGTGATSSAAYDAAQRPTTLTNGAGERTTIGYDANSQPLSILDGAGNGQHFAWNADGFLQSATDALSHSTGYTTDALGRVLSLTTPLNEKWNYAYDKLGRLVNATTPLSNTAKFSYDARGGLVRTDLPASVSASYARNDLGLVSGVTDPNGGVWALSYDSTGRLSGGADPLGRSTQVQYDLRSRPAGASNAAGSVKLSYDPLGNPVEAQFSDGTDLKFQYAAGSRLIGAANLTLAYDGDGRIVSSNGIGIARDGAGRMAGVTYGPGLAVTYKYNSVGELTEVDDWVGGATTFQYDAAHQLIAAARPNGSTTQYSYDADGRLTGKTYTNPDGTAYSFSVQFDGEGKVVSANRSMPQLPQPASGFNGYTYDAAHQISGATYDASGRLLSDGLRTYTWDLASRLTSYTGADGAAQFTYDGLGLRVSRTTSADETDYVWNYGHTLPALATVRSGGADLRYYVYLPNGALMHSIEAADNSRRYYHFDETGSTAFLTDDTGSVSDAYGLTPFGETVTQSGTTDNPFTFHGAWGAMQEGGTSMYYMRTRYYDSAAQRFLSRDPVGSLDPLQINPYQFALNNPVGFRDPSGASAEPSNPAPANVAPAKSVAETVPNVTIVNSPGPAAPTATSSASQAKKLDLATALLSYFLIRSNPYAPKLEAWRSLLGEDFEMLSEAEIERRRAPITKLIGVDEPTPDPVKLTPDTRLDNLVM